MNKTTVALLSALAAVMVAVPTVAATEQTTAVADNQIDCTGGFGGPLVTWVYQTACYEVGGICDELDPCPITATKQ